MSSWGLLIAASGFAFDMAKGEIAFKPAIGQDQFQTFWSTGKGWGMYKQYRDEASGELAFSVEVLGGRMKGTVVHACGTSIRL
ncbi:hypothetical protein D3C84_1218790 [compost metagenome]